MLSMYSCSGRTHRGARGGCEETSRLSYRLNIRCGVALQQSTRPTRAGTCHAALCAGGGCCYKDPVNPTLRDRGYLPVKTLIEPGVARFMYKALLLKQWRGECYRDSQAPTTVSVADDATTDALLLELQPRIEAIAGLPSRAHLQLRATLLLWRRHYATSRWASL